MEAKCKHGRVSIDGWRLDINIDDIVTQAVTEALNNEIRSDGIHLTVGKGYAPKTDLAVTIYLPFGPNSDEEPYFSAPLWELIEEEIEDQDAEGVVEIRDELQAMIDRINLKIASESQ